MAKFLAQIRRFAPFVLLAATVVVFWPVHQFDFVNFDDPDYVSANSHVLAGLTSQGIAWAFTTGAAGNWHPLTWLSLMCDVQLFGPDPGLMHLVNLLFHSLNCCLVLLVLKRMTGAYWRSLSVAALFALHPLHVESVAWISERKDVLCAFFFLLTLLAYARWTSTDQKAKASTRARRYALLFLCYACALMSKPMAVTLPFLLLLLDYWPLARLEIGRGRNEAAATPPGRSHSLMLSLILEKLPLLLLAALSSLVTFRIQREEGAMQGLAHLAPTLRLENALVACVRYLAKTAWPTHLAIFYPHPGQWPAAVVWGSAATVLGVSLAGVTFRARVPFVLVGWLWFLGMLVPVLGLVQVGIQSMADRYTYLPSIGVFIVCVWGFEEIVVRKREKCRENYSRVHPLNCAVGGLLVLGCGWATHHQLLTWKNSETLFRHATRVTSQNAMAYNNLADFLLNSERLDEALTNYLKAIEIAPEYTPAHINYGRALAAKGNFDQAISQYHWVLAAHPRDFLALLNLGDALLAKGEFGQAILAYHSALDVQPDSLPAQNNLAYALVRSGDYEQAAQVYRQLLPAHPGVAQLHYAYALVLIHQAKRAEAESELAKALQLAPDYREASEELAKLRVGK